MTHYIARIILYIVLEQIVFYQADFVTSTDIVCTKALYQQQQQRMLRVTISCRIRARANCHYSRQTISSRCDTHPRLEKSGEIRTFNLFADIVIVQINNQHVGTIELSLELTRASYLDRAACKIYQRTDL